MNAQPLLLTSTVQYSTVSLPCSSLSSFLSSFLHPIPFHTAPQPPAPSYRVDRSYTIDTQLSEPQISSTHGSGGNGVRTLQFRQGSQLDVPTMPFIAHMISTAQGVVDNLDAEEKKAGDKKPLTVEETAEKVRELCGWGRLCACWVAAVAARRICLLPPPPPSLLFPHSH